MSRSWTDEELQAASEQMEAQGYLSFSEFKIGLGLTILEGLMEEYGCSKKQLADILGTSRQNVSQVFKGGQYFTVKQIRIMADYFQMTPELVCECFALL